MANYHEAKLKEKYAVKFLITSTFSTKNKLNPTLVLDRKKTPTNLNPSSILDGKKDPTKINHFILYRTKRRRDISKISELVKIAGHLDSWTL